MAINSVSTYGSLQTLLQNVNTVQNSLNNSQVQISSGYVSPTFEGLGDSVEQYVSLNAQVTRLNNYQQGNGITVSRLQAVNTALGQVIQLGNSVKSLVAAQPSNTSGGNSFALQLGSSRDTLTGQLNLTFQGKYVFGGTATNRAPIREEIPLPVEYGKADTSYYQGGTENTTTRIADDQLMENTIRADNPAFQNLYGGIALAMKEGATTEDLLKAQDMINTGIQGVISLQATANATIVRVQQVDKQSESVKTYYSSLAQTMAKSDVVALSTKVVQDQSILQASFSTFARISALTLANYLK